MEPVWQISRGKTTFFSTLSWQWLMATHLKSLVCGSGRGKIPYIRLFCVSGRLFSTWEFLNGKKGWAHTI